MSPEAIDILEQRIQAESKRRLRWMDVDAAAIRANGAKSDAAVSVQDFRQRLESIEPEDVEEIALHFQEAAATWSKADQNRAVKELREKGMTATFCREWRTAVRAVRKEWKDEVEDDEPERLTTDLVAAAIQETDHFARDEGGNLWFYEDGVYRPEGRERVERRTKEIFLERKQESSWSSYRADEVRKFILADAPSLLERPPSTKINLANGIYDTEVRELRPHTPEFRTPIQLPVKYDPDATCPKTEEFLETVLPADVLEASVHWQIVAWILTTDMSVQKALLLLGGGANGKSTWLQALTAFLGHDNVVNKSLQHLETNRFATVSLMGRLANICPDLPSEHLTGTAVFKALTGGDRLHAEYKHGASFDYRPYCKLLFSANDPPRSSDSSEAFYRRWIAVSFPRTFRPHEQRPREELDAELSDPAELSGVLNKALEWLPRVRQRGITDVSSMRSAHDEFRQATDPFSVWAENVLVERVDAIVSCADARKEYNRAAKREGWPSMTENRFGKRIRDVFPKINRGRRTWKGEDRIYCYIGIGLDAESPESPAKPNCTKKAEKSDTWGDVGKADLFVKDRAKRGERGDWEEEMLERAVEVS